MNLAQAARAFVSLLPKPTRTEDGRKTHDYTMRGPGHDCTFRPINGGLEADMIGWGHGLEKGDYLILSNGADTTRYQIAEIKYFSDPPDMWALRAKFAPRGKPQQSKGG
mgnify:CR=1 FL=1